MILTVKVELFAFFDLAHLSILCYLAKAVARCTSQFFCVRKRWQKCSSKLVRTLMQRPRFVIFQSEHCYLCSPRTLKKCLYLLSCPKHSVVRFDYLACTVLVSMASGNSSLQKAQGDTLTTCMPTQHEILPIVHCFNVTPGRSTCYRQQ